MLKIDVPGDAGAQVSCPVAAFKFMPDGRFGDDHETDCPPVGVVASVT